jgi:hypothetical protein
MTSKMGVRSRVGVGVISGNGVSVGVSMINVGVKVGVKVGVGVDVGKPPASANAWRIGGAPHATNTRISARGKGARWRSLEQKEGLFMTAILSPDELEINGYIVPYSRAFVLINWNVLLHQERD